jgi:hypothetical protein
MPAMRVALAGATGNLGRPLLLALLKSGHSVRVLSRIGGNSSSLPRPEGYQHLIVRKVDFSSQAQLSELLNGIDVVICCFGSNALGQQRTLIDAAIAAKVPRYIPAEFGMDSCHPLCMDLPLVGKPKAETQQYLQQKVAENPWFSWTGIANGLFLDWGIEVGFIVDMKRRQADLVDNGNTKFSATLLGDVCRAVMAVIANGAQTKNRIVYVHSAAVTQNEVIAYAGEVDCMPWTTKSVHADNLWETSMTQLQNGQLNEAMDGFCKVIEASAASSWTACWSR